MTTHQSAPVSLPPATAAAATATRVALGTAFLSAVADRFGVWGPPGAPGVAWGDFARFTAYAGTLNAFLPDALYPALAWTATAAEVALGVLLLLDRWARWTALASGVLLLLFALAMTAALGVKAPVDYSVFTASAAAFLVASLSPRAAAAHRRRAPRTLLREPVAERAVAHAHHEP